MSSDESCGGPRKSLASPRSPLTRHQLLRLQHQRNPARTYRPPPARARDIRAFLQEKRPASDNQFAAAVAYYFAFEAPASERKAEITASDLQQAARLSGRARLKRPIYTLHNASRRGYLDKGSARGSFRINTVGENLVAMTMPGADADESAARRRAQKRSSRKPRQGRRK